MYKSCHDIDIIIYYPSFGFRSGLKREEETKSANESSKPYISNSQRCHRHPETSQVLASWSRRPQRNKYSSGCSKRPWISKILTAIQYEKNGKKNNSFGSLDHRINSARTPVRIEEAFGPCISPTLLLLLLLHLLLLIATCPASGSLWMILIGGKCFLQICVTWLLASLVVAKRTGWLSIVALRRIATLRNKLSNTKSGQSVRTVRTVDISGADPWVIWATGVWSTSRLCQPSSVQWSTSLKAQDKHHGHVTNAARKRLLVTMVSLCRPHGGLRVNLKDLQK